MLGKVVSVSIPLLSPQGSWGQVSPTIGGWPHITRVTDTYEREDTE